MNCPNCGARVTSIRCDYCGTLITNTESKNSSKLSEMEAEKNSLLQRISAIDKMIMPDEVKERKKKILYEKIAKLG